jgi:hypothetical protein
LVIAIFATSQDLFCFVANSPSYFASLLLPIEALPSLNYQQHYCSREPSPNFSLLQRRPPAFAQAHPEDSAAGLHFR